MKYPHILLALVFSIAASPAMSEVKVMDRPMSATTLKFADSYASTFYTVDKDIYNVVVAIATGSQEDDQMIRQKFQLAEGETYQFSIGAYGIDQRPATLSMTRKEGRILAEVRN